MIPLFECPNAYVEVLSGTVTSIELVGTQLTIVVKFEYELNLSRNTDWLTFDLSNQYVYSNLIASVGSFCWEKNVLDFSKLLGERVMVIYKSSMGRYENFLNFHCLVLLNQLQLFNYPTEVGGVDHV
ncbi:hypothetical protein JNUCC83_08870 [Vagococcus sp. JNUCC 83]